MHTLVNLQVSVKILRSEDAKQKSVNIKHNLY